MLSCPSICPGSPSNDCFCRALHLIAWALDNVLLTRFNDNPYLVLRQGRNISMNRERSNATMKLVDLTSDGAATNKEGNTTDQADDMV